MECTLSEYFWKSKIADFLFLNKFFHFPINVILFVQKNRFAVNCNMTVFAKNIKITCHKHKRADLKCKFLNLSEISFKNLPKDEKAHKRKFKILYFSISCVNSNF